MYNMNVSIFGYKLKVEILLLFAFIVVILLSHTLFGSYNGMEGLEDMKKSMDETKKSMDEDEEGNEPFSTKSKKESFVGANINYGQSSQYDLDTQTVVDTKSWNAPNMTVVPGKPLSDGVKKFLERKQQQLPLPEGEMDFLANSEFKPECCPSTYSNSSGCWCGTAQDYNYLITRGGNNVPYSEY
jgi:hypothetical protein